MEEEDGLCATETNQLDSPLPDSTKMSRGNLDNVASRQQHTNSMPSPTDGTASSVQEPRILEGLRNDKSNVDLARSDPTEPITPQAQSKTASLSSYVHVLLMIALVSVLVNGVSQLPRMSMGNGGYALFNADGHAVPETGQTVANLSRARRFRSFRWMTHLTLGMLYLMTITQGALGLEKTDRLSVSSDQDTISAANNELGWPFGPGLPSFDGWPFIVFGLAFVIAALSLTMIKKSKRAAIFGIGTAVSNFLGLTIMADEKMTPAVMWT